MSLINKIAFLVHEPTMYIHYSSVWEKMDRDSFVVVLYGRCELDDDESDKDVLSFVELIKKHNYTIDYFSQIVSRGDLYQYVISNHVMGGNSLIPCSRKQKLQIKVSRIICRIQNCIGALGGREKTMLLPDYLVQYCPMQIGIKQIRFMYGADIGDGWSLQDWNEMYDLFLCHGPNDVAELKKRFKGKTEIMGYPRYDGYFNESLDVAGIVEEFGLDPTKKTILWMPTTGEGACSLPEFAKPISQLMQRFNIIVRPHPISFRAEPDCIELLRSFNYKIDSSSMRDMNALYRNVDFVLCDYGGSSFGAIYLDKNLILLDVKGSDNSYCVINSSNLQIRNYFPIVHPEGSQKIETLIDDDQLWADQKKNRRMLFEQYFADNRGESSLCAAQILGRLSTILS